MPITFDCHRCGRSLQVPDALGGGLAQCPHCKIVCPVPNELPPPAPEDASDEHPVLIPEPSAEPKPEAPLELDPEPAADPVPVFTLAEPSEELPPENPLPPPALPPWIRGSRDPAPWLAVDAPNPGARSRGAPGRWAPFAEGCKVVQWGIAAELIGVAVLFALLEMLVLALGEVLKPPRDRDVLQWLPLAALLPMTVGALLIAVGRLMIVRLPLATNATAVLILAAGLSWLRFVMLAIAVLCLIQAAITSTPDTRSQFVTWTGRVLLLATWVGTVAELSAVSGLAVVGGEMPSRQLRQSAATMTFVIQLMASLGIAVLIGMTYVAATREVLPERSVQPAPQGPRGLPPQRLDPDTVTAALSIVVGFMFALQAGYAYLHHSLYGAGRYSGDTDGDRYP